MGLCCVFARSTAERVSELLCSLLLFQVVPYGLVIGAPRLAQAPREGRQSPTTAQPQQGLACAHTHQNALCSPTWAQDEKAGLTLA